MGGPAFDKMDGVACGAVKEPEIAQEMENAGKRVRLDGIIIPEAFDPCSGRARSVSLLSCRDYDHCFAEL